MQKTDLKILETIVNMVGHVAYEEVKKYTSYVIDRAAKKAWSAFWREASRASGDYWRSRGVIVRWEGGLNVRFTIEEATNMIEEIEIENERDYEFVVPDGIEVVQ